MSDERPEVPEVSVVLNQLIAEFMTRTDAGEDLTPEQFIADHPESADELRRHFGNVSLMEGLIQTGAGSHDETLSQPSVAKEACPDDLTANTVLRGSGGSETSFTRNPGTKNTGTATSIEIPKTFGRYAIQKILGQGAMGAVYLARDTQLDRDVALKIPKFGDENGVDDEELLERFYREARASATLRSPNICPVYDVGEIDGQHYITMAFIEGRPLKDFTKSKKKHSEKQIITTIRKLTLGLAEAHSIGVIHRDLKPANIMVDLKGEPVVMDFGLARRSSSDDVQVTQSGAILGTPAYMAPEQVAGDQTAINHQVDIYALGIIMYELITGEMPFKGNLMAILQQIALNNPTKPSQLRPDIDRRLETICLNMIAGNQQRRYQSMDDVAHDLQEVLRNPNKRQKKEQVKKSVSKPTSIPTANEESNPALISIAQPKSFAQQLREKKGKPSTKSSKILPDTIPSNDSSNNTKKYFIAGGLGGLVLLLGIVFFVRIGKYDVQITLDDPTITLSVDDKVLNIKDGKDVYKFSAGKHKLKLEKEDFTTHVEEFTVTKDGRTALRAVVVNNKLDGLINGEKPSASNSEPTKPGENNVDLSRGLVAHWNFEDGAHSRVGDSSGNQNAGRIEGGIEWQSEAAPSPFAGERSLRFIDGKMVVPASRSLAVKNEMAFAFWCKLDEQSQGRLLLKTGPLEITNGHQRINFNYKVSGSPVKVFRDSGDRKPDQFLSGRWNHVVVNCTGSSSEMWYNGQLLASHSLEGAMTDSVADYYLGNNLSGSLDDFRIYGRPLSPREIQTLANLSRKEVEQLNVSDSFSTEGGFGQFDSNRSIELPHSFNSGLSFPSPESRVLTEPIDINLSQPFCLEAWFDPRNHYDSDVWQRTIADFGPIQLTISNSGDESVGVFVYDDVEGVVGVGKSEFLDYRERVAGLTHAAIQWTGSDLHLFVNGKLSTHTYESYGQSEQPANFLKSKLSEFQSATLSLGTPKKEGSEGHLSSNLYQVKISAGILYTSNFTPAAFESDSETKALYRIDNGTGDTLKDSSGNGHDGKIVGAKWVNQNKTIDNVVSDTDRNFLRFDINKLQNGDRPPVVVETLAAALKKQLPKSITVEGRIRRRAIGHNMDGVILGMKYNFRLTGTGGTVGVLSMRNHNHPDAKREIVGSAPVNYPAEQWIHLAAVADGELGEQRLYIDGKLAVPPDSVAPLLDPTQNIDHLIMGYGFNGDIDWGRISDTARYTTDFTPAYAHIPDEHTLALYNFESGKGAILRDSSGNGHNGKIDGAKWIKPYNEKSQTKLTPLATEGGLFIEKGVNQFPIATDVSLNFAQPFTIETWVTPSFERAVFHNVLSIGSEENTNIGIWNHQDWQVGINEKAKYLRGSQEGTYVPNELVHIASVYDGKTLRMFVNGMESEQSLKKFVTGKMWRDINVFEERIDLNLSELILGKGYQNFTGTYHAVRISGIARYEANFTPPDRLNSDSGTIALYQFDENSGDTFRDSSGNGFHGNIGEAKWANENSSR